MKEKGIKYTKKLQSLKFVYIWLACVYMIEKITTQIYHSLYLIVVLKGGRRGDKVIEVGRRRYSYKYNKDIFASKYICLLDIFPSQTV